MSSKARKLAKNIVLTQTQASGTKHGCEQCRSTEFRQKLTRDLVRSGAVAMPLRIQCAACEARWLVKFGSDKDGMATVAFHAPVLN